MDRLEAVRQVIDEIVHRQPDREERRCGFVHLYGVAAICSLLALKRGLDPELCAVAGMLHDIWSYKTGQPEDHARLGAREAKAIMERLDHCTSEEITQVSQAIALHGQKDHTDEAMDELLKDADVFQHYVYNPAMNGELRHHTRVRKVLQELGIS